MSTTSWNVGRPCQDTYSTALYIMSVGSDGLFSLFTVSPHFVSFEVSLVPRSAHHAHVYRSSILTRKSCLIDTKLLSRVVSKSLAFFEHSRAIKHRTHIFRDLRNLWPQNQIFVCPKHRFCPKFRQKCVFCPNFLNWFNTPCFISFSPNYYYCIQWTLISFYFSLIINVNSHENAYINYNVKQAWLLM